MGGCSEDFDCAARDKNPEITRNKVWEVTKSCYKKDADTLKEKIAQANSKGETKVSVEYPTRTMGRIIGEMMREDGFSVSFGYYTSSIGDDRTLEVSWRGYAYKPYDYTYHRDSNEKDVKREPTVRDKAWEEVKKIHEPERKKMQGEIDSRLLKGDVAFGFTFDTCNQARILDQIFSEDGYYTDVQDVSGMLNFFTGYKKWALTIRIIR